MDKTKQVVAAKEKKLRRKEELAKKKAIDEVIREAYRREDHLLEVPDLLKYNSNGVSVTLESTSGALLSKPTQQIFQGILKINMEDAYGAEWPKEEKVKRREMVDEDALYIVVRLDERDHIMKDKISDVILSSKRGNLGIQEGLGSPVVAFVHYRFVVEEDFPVLYVYELQLEKSVQGKGLGKFLMQLLELIACKNKMKAVMLTVQKRNIGAMDFYKGKLSYKVSNHSPSRVDPVVWADCSYEILCKAFSPDAKLKFEDG